MQRLPGHCRACPGVQLFLEGVVPTASTQSARGHSISGQSCAAAQEQARGVRGGGGGVRSEAHRVPAVAADELFALGPCHLPDLEVLSSRAVVVSEGGVDRVGFQHGGDVIGQRLVGVRCSRALPLEGELSVAPFVVVHVVSATVAFVPEHVVPVKKETLLSSLRLGETSHEVVGPTEGSCTAHSGARHEAEIISPRTTQGGARAAAGSQQV